MILKCKSDERVDLYYDIKAIMKQATKGLYIGEAVDLILKRVDECK